MQRVGQFIAKLVLRKHQRALVTSFKKFQLNNLETEEAGSAVRANDDPETKFLDNNATVQARSDISVLDSYGHDPNLTDLQHELLKEIAENFSPRDSAADLSILYEVTGYKADCQSDDFWDSYRDFEELGEDKLVYKNNNESNLKGEENEQNHGNSDIDSD